MQEATHQKFTSDCWWSVEQRRGDFVSWEATRWSRKPDNSNTCRPVEISRVFKTGVLFKVCIYWVRYDFGELHKGTGFLFVGAFLLVKKAHGASSNDCQETS
jgi:hypothetical protein